MAGITAVPIPREAVISLRLRSTDDPTPDRTALKLAIEHYAIQHGEFSLSGGRTSTWYMDLRTISLHGPTARAMGRAMLTMVKDWRFAAVGGMTLGADPVAAAMMHQADLQGRVLNAFVVRKAAKLHGTLRRIEGPRIRGRRVVVVEDTSTSGETVLAAAKAAIADGGIVVGVAMMVDRGGGMAVESVGLPFRSLFTQADFGLE